MSSQGYTYDIPYEEGICIVAEFLVYRLWRSHRGNLDRSNGNVMVEQIVLYVLSFYVARRNNHIFSLKIAGDRTGEG